MRLHASGTVAALKGDARLLTGCFTVGVNIRNALKDTTLPTGGGSTGTSPVGIPTGTTLREPSLSSMLLLLWFLT